MVGRDVTGWLMSGDGVVLISSAELPDHSGDATGDRGCWWWVAREAVASVALDGDQEVNLDEEKTWLEWEDEYGR